MKKLFYAKMLKPLMQPTYGAVDVSAHHVDSRRCHKFALRRVPRRTRWIGILSTDAGLI
jgi:hypothetical protein